MRLLDDHLGCLLNGREAEAGRGAEIIAPFVVADSQHGTAGPDEEGLASGCFGSRDDAGLLGFVFHRVELHHVDEGAE